MSRRNVVVLVSLLGSLTLTSILLLVMAPAPLPATVKSLYAVEQLDRIDLVFDTRQAIRPQRWRYIYIHHSKSIEGNSSMLARGNGTMGDHFLIGNGAGCSDGEIQIGRRWDSQQPGSPVGAQLADNCISIVLVGDFEQAGPTRRQLARLEELVESLQQRLGIAGEAVVFDEREAGPGGIGRHFPSGSFRRQLRP
jgi:hypothetical protein